MSRQLNINDLNFVTSEDVALWQAGRTEEGLANQQAGIDEVYLTIDYTPKENGQVKVETLGTSSHNATNDNLSIKLKVNDSVASPTEERIIRNLESKDSAGAGQTVNVVQGGVIIGSVNSGTDNQSDYSGGLLKDVTAGVTYTFSLEWNCQSGNDEGSMLTGILGFIKTK